MLAPAQEFIRKVISSGGRRPRVGDAASDKNGMHLLKDPTETSADCGTNQMQNLLQMRCGTI
jgi:hypothetical protein